ncbi:MAG: hypothetical protein AB7O56_01940 [Bauldia sp.]
MAAHTEYIPGVCNIGTEEIRRRRNSGVLALGFTAVLFIGLFAMDASPWWFAILFLPSAAAAISLLQASFRFCVYFGLFALFNFGRGGETTRVASERAKSIDRAAAIRMITYGMAVAATFTSLAVLLAANR